MAYKELPPLDLLRQLFSYDPPSGEIRWKHRDLSTFRGKRPRDAYAAFVAWNNKYPGTIAGGAGSPDRYKSLLAGDGKYLAHRIVWYMHTGEQPCGEIDHINGNRSDNRISNLRVVTALENLRNTQIPKNNTSGILGVAWDDVRQKWRATIANEGKRITIGRYDTVEHAFIARKAAEKALGFHVNHGRQPVAD